MSGSGEPEGDLEAAIVRDFGSVAAMKEKLSASTVAVQVGLEFDVVRSKICYSLTYFHLILGLRMGLAWVQQGCWEVANCHLCQSGG